MSVVFLFLQFVCLMFDLGFFLAKTAQFSKSFIRSRKLPPLISGLALGKQIIYLRLIAPARQTRHHNHNNNNNTNNR